MWGYVLISIVVGYFCGCFQTAYIIGRFNKIDIREHGSGNAGTTNTLRTLGKRAALLTFLGDALKGIVGVLLARYLFAPMSPSIDANVLCLLAGFGAVLGHNFPFYLHFKGGKGIATTAAVSFAFDWRFGVVSLILFASICLITRYVSVASLALSLAFPVNILVFYHTSPDWIQLLASACLFTILAFIRHKENIKRLLNGTENKLGQKAKA